MQNRDEILTLFQRFRELGIEQQIDYDKFYLYSIITHSAPISDWSPYIRGPMETDA